MAEKIDMTADLWTIREVAAFFRVDEKSAAQRVVSRPGFPRGLRPTGAVKGERRWWASDVKEWAREAA